MDITIIEEKKNKFVFELPGEDHTFCNLLREELWNDKDVDVSAYKVDHPLLGTPKVHVETKKGDAKKAVMDAADRVKKNMVANNKAFAKV